MNKIVNVFNRNLALEVEPARDTCLVSISTPRFEYARDMTKAGWKDSIFVDFDDTIPELIAMEKDFNNPGPIVLFTMDHAKELLSFIETNDGAPFLVHCDAGISRSVAVGAFMRDFFNYVPWFRRTVHDEFRNIHVYNLLRRAAMGIDE